MRIIALMNQKGGVGKTTTTVNLGAALAELGKRVCLIDLDPQAHLTINYGVEPNPNVPSLYDVLVEERPFVDAVHKVAEGSISLIPSSIDLAAAEVELVSVLGRETLLKRRIEATQHDFDFILLDCPPSLGLLTLNALSAADEVIIPMQPHFFALQGVAKLLETVQLVAKRINPKLKVSGIVLTMYDSNTKLTNEVVSELNSFIVAAQGRRLPWSETVIFKSKIRRNIKLAESPSFGQTILAYEPTSNGAIDYRALAREVAAMNDPKFAEIVAKLATAVVPEPAPEIGSEVAAELAPEVASEIAPELATAVAPEPAAANASEVAPEIAPEVATAVAPEIGTAVAPEPAAESESEVAPEIVPEVVPELAPTIASETAPEITPELAPEIHRPIIEVTINTDIDPSKLAAANVELPGDPEPPADVPSEAEAVA